MVAKSLSANTLFHFTPKLEYLQSIIVNGLYPRLSKEVFYGAKDSNSGDLSVCIPMICFCDIPLSQIGNHISTYGGYAAGLTKSWGLANSVTPVLYYYPNGPTFNLMLRAFKVLNSLSEEAGVKDRKALSDDLLFLTTYFKPYEGNFDKTGLHTRFYDEREWRFIPYDYIKYSFFAQNDADGKKKEDMNDKLVAFPLVFEPSDVRYILVNDEIEIYPMIEYIQKQKRNYSFHDVQLLTTKIITTKQVMEDF